MDFQQLCDSMAAMTCVMSVEKREGGYGTIRIVTGNSSYIQSIENPTGGVEMMTREFVPNSEYTNYFSRDLNFEEFCFQSAVNKKCLHSYVHPERIPVWFNLTFLPVNADDGDLCYCTYTMEIDQKPDSERMSNIAGDLASRVLAIGIKLRATSDFEAAMGEVIEDIRKLCDAELCSILLMDEFKRESSVLCESISADTHLKPMVSILDEDFYNLMLTWENVIAGSNCLIAKDQNDMEVVRQRNPRWYQSLSDYDINNIVLFPLKARSGLLGYIFALNFDPENALRIKETLEVMTFILSSEIANYLLLDRLKILSSRDMLTGVANRNEMNDVVEALSNKTEHPGESVGILFADLNGLKEVNDVDGHDDGDRLLKNAARVLCGLFEPSQIFRAGGDEFVVIVNGITEAELAEKAAAVKDAEKRFDDVSFAIGTCVVADSADVRLALHNADERMYADKRAYYEANPEKKRRSPKDESREQVATF